MIRVTVTSLVLVEPFRLDRGVRHDRWRANGQGILWPLPFSTGRAGATDPHLHKGIGDRARENVRAL